MFRFAGKNFDNGTVLTLGIRYGNGSKTFTYAAVKAGDQWYLTGGGKVPVAAGAGAVDRWLARDDRRVVWVKAATSWASLPLDASPASE